MNRFIRQYLEMNNRPPVILDLYKDDLALYKDNLECGNSCRHHD